MGLIWTGFALAAPDRQDVMQLSGPEVAALQQRLKEARCYTGAIDGKASASLQQAVNTCPDQRPALTIETGMHTAVVRRIGVDAACRLMATGSDDKTVRLWSLPDGRLQRTLRLPAGIGNFGKIFATAVSPDGRFVAAGGWDAHRELEPSHGASIFDAASGAMVARVGDFENVILHLAFSHDGRWLAATLGSGQGVRMIDTATWKKFAADKPYGSRSDGAAFAPDGRLYTVADDGKIRRYGPGPGFKLEATVVAHSGKQPKSIAVDAAGQRLAVGFGNTTAVDLYDAPSLALLAAADTTGIDNGNLNSVAWRSDGQVLIAGGRYDQNGQSQFLLFDRDGKRLTSPPALAVNTIYDLTPCGDGFAVATGDPAFGLLDRNGQQRLWTNGVTADMRDKVGDAFRVSGDGRRVRFGLGVGAAQPVLFDLWQATLADSPVVPQDLATPRVDGLPVRNWKDNDNPIFNGKPIALQQYETSRSLAVRPANDGFVLGADWWVRNFDKAGQEQWKQPGPGVAWGVNVTGDGRLVIVAYDDGTIRWLRASDGRELLALFVNSKTRAWVAWTPSGYYSASPGGEEMIGWRVNRGWTQAADFFPAAQFRATYARADVVQRILDTLDENEALRLANLVRGREQEAAPKPIIEELPPVVSILSPADGTAIAGDEARIDYLVRSPSGLAVTGIEALIDGRPASGARGVGRVNDVAQCLSETRGVGRSEGGLQGCRGTLTVSLPPGASEVGLLARAGERVGTVVRVHLTRGMAASGAELLKPKLYALVVGISDYRDPTYRLGFAAKDARDFATALGNQKGGLYGEVALKVLTDGEATATGIRDGFDWLTKQVTSRDVGVVYLAGHGLLDERDRFYFMASDTDPARTRATAVPREDIADALNALAGKALLFLDACHAGAVASDATRRGVGLDMNTIVQEFSRSERGVVTFAASTGRQVSQENASWQNGAFTKAVVEALGLPGRKAGADLLGDGRITTSALDVYVTQRVKTLTGGNQSPVMYRPSTVPDFPIAVGR